MQLMVWQTLANVINFFHLSTSRQTRLYNSYLTYMKLGPEGVNGVNQRVEVHSDQIRPYENRPPLQRSRVPAFLRSTMRSRIAASSIIAEQGSSVIGSKWRELVQSQLSSIIRPRICQICETEITIPKEQQVHPCDCPHKYQFCQNCLHQYAIYKVNNFEEVLCPNDECDKQMDLELPFFRQLPGDIQRKYRRVQRFQLTVKDPTLKLCPNQHCEGIIRPYTAKYMVCNTCFVEFCPKCLLRKHKGSCERQEALALQKNLNYRQCKRCNFVIERTHGCNHMTCICGHQFCYICGVRWSHEHYSDHNRNGRLPGWHYSDDQEEEQSSSDEYPQMYPELVVGARQPQINRTMVAQPQRARQMYPVEQGDDASDDSSEEWDQDRWCWTQRPTSCSGWVLHISKLTVLVLFTIAVLAVLPIILLVYVMTRIALEVPELTTRTCQVYQDVENPVGKILVIIFMPVLLVAFLIVYTVVEIIMNNTKHFIADELLPLYLNASTRIMNCA